MASGSGVNQSKRHYYHYTNKDGIEGIKDTGVIHASTDTVRDAMLGEAVYLTDVAPCNPKGAILQNNYGNGPGQRKNDRADYYVKIPRESVSTYKADDGDRVIYRSKYDGQPLDVSQIEGVKVGRNGKWEIPIDHSHCIDKALQEESQRQQARHDNYSGGYGGYEQDHYDQQNYGGYDVDYY